jgi:acetyl-CoA carboxylase biotin carboxyl carrier protein
VAFLSFKEILELIDKVAESGIASVEVESAGVKIRVDGPSKEVVGSYAPSESGGTTVHHYVSAPSPSPEAAPRPVAGEDEVDPSWHIITSPIVGTFYRAANPEADVFANVGDRVTKGKVLCIIEAMKLMNEIESDMDGVVTKIFPQNGQPIEYGEKLFAIKA